jgi:hypothetical protein
MHGHMNVRFKGTSDITAIRNIIPIVLFVQCRDECLQQRDKNSKAQSPNHGVTNVVEWM